ncbi:MAG: chemotaxis protein CheA [Spirochaetia bacterium]
MEITAGMRDAFIRDTKELYTSLEDYLIRLTSDSADQDALHGAFRCVHSIKSEAGFTGLEGLERVCISAEDILQGMREQNIPISQDEIGNLSGKIEMIKIELDNYRNSYYKDESVEASLPDSKQGIPEAENSLYSLFDDFEKQLVNEAFERGESLYKLRCELSPECKMKYARAYLLINNLEMTVNVIKTIPEVIEGMTSSVIRIYFTTDMKLKEVYSAVNIDEVERIEISELDYSSYVQKAESGTTELQEVLSQGHQLTSILVDISELHKISGYIDDLRLKLIDMKNEISTGAGLPIALNNGLSIISQLVLGMSDAVRDAQMAPISELFLSIPSFASKLAAEMGKKVSIDIEAKEGKTDRRIIEALKDPLLHLVRNAVDHGIETPDDRKKYGKNETGHIRLQSEVRDGKLHITCIDDGKGMDVDEMKKTALQLNFDPDYVDSNGLMQIIRLPGFSTLTQASSFSGRGVGMDSVYQRITETLKGQIQCESTANVGTSFTITIPETKSIIEVMLVKWENMRLAVQKQYVEKTVLIQGNEILQGNDSMYYKGPEGRKVPVFTPEGKLLKSITLDQEKYGLLINYLDYSGLLLIDDLLFEKEMMSEHLQILEEIQPNIRRIELGKTPLDFQMLIPSIVMG